MLHKAKGSNCIERILAFSRLLTSSVNRIILICLLKRINRVKNSVFHFPHCMRPKVIEYLGDVMMVSSVRVCVQTYLRSISLLT